MIGRSEVPPMGGAEQEGNNRELPPEEAQKIGEAVLLMAMKLSTQLESSKRVEFTGLMAENLAGLDPKQAEILMKNFLKIYENANGSGSSADKPIDKPAEGGDGNGGEKPAEAPAGGDGEKPAEAPASGDGEKPAEAPASGDGEKPAGAPASGDGEKPAEAPAGGDGEKPADAPVSVEGEKPDDKQAEGGDGNGGEKPEENKAEKSEEEKAAELRDKLFSEGEVRFVDWLQRVEKINPCSLKGKSYEEMSVISNRYTRYVRMGLLSYGATRFVKWYQSTGGDMKQLRRMDLSQILAVNKDYDKYRDGKTEIRPLIAMGISGETLFSEADNVSQEMMREGAEKQQPDAVWDDLGTSANLGQTRKLIGERNALQYKKETGELTDDESKRLDELNGIVGEATWAGSYGDIERFINAQYDLATVRARRKELGKDSDQRTDVLEVSIGKNGKYIVRNSEGKVVNLASLEAQHAVDVYDAVRKYANDIVMVENSKVNSDMKRKARERVLARFKTAMGSIRGGEKIALVMDNYEEVVEEAAKRAMHGKSMDDVMRGFQVIHRGAFETKSERNKDAVRSIKKQLNNGESGKTRVVPAATAGEALDGGDKQAADDSRAENEEQSEGSSNSGMLTKENFANMSGSEVATFMKNAYNAKRGTLSKEEAQKLNEAVKTWNRMSTEKQRNILEKHNGRWIYTDRNESRAMSVLVKHGLIGGLDEGPKKKPASAAAVKPAGAEAA